MIHFILGIWHWLLVATGSLNTSGTQYGFWSGFGSDIGEVTIIIGLITWYKSGECHIDTCHRRGRYPFQHYKLCRLHHPEVPAELTHAHILALHKHDRLKVKEQ